ncbi:MAG: hypothetical protein JWN93_2658 [Hyphomicrobiales bacterium]|nr:hypothetical protein [Hyphomicrobiales bacterium]
MTRTLKLALMAGALALPASFAHAAQANLCAELTAYLDQLKPAGAQGAEGAKPSGDAHSPSSGQQGGATAVEQGGGQPSGAKPQPGGTDATQKTSGMTGPVTQEGVGAAGPQGAAQHGSGSGETTTKPVQQQEAAKPTAPAPATPAQPKAPDPTPEAIEQARAAAGGGDLAGCRASVQQMRRAGVAMPLPLLALGALDVKLLTQSK